MELTARRLALALCIPSQRIYDLIAGKRGISLDTALRLSVFFGTSHEMWLRLQADYEYQVAQDEGLIEKVGRQVKTRAEFLAMDVGE